MKILHLDIETAPNKVYAWGLWNQDIGINQIVEPGYTLCWAAKWNNKREVLFNSIHKSSREEMIAEIHALIMEADAVCHYNGTKFDMKVLNWEFMDLGLDRPHKYPQIDLLKVVKKQFRFPSNKLDYVAQALNLGAKTKHMGMQLWRDCMAGDDKAWGLMERYNKQDVRLLEKLYKRLLPWIDSHPNYAVYTDAERPTCSNCGSTKVVKVGVQRTRTLTYQRYRCKNCGKPLRGRRRVQPAPEGALVE